MDTKTRKAIVEGTHNLDEALAQLTELIQFSSDHIEDGDDKLANFVSYLKHAGFSDVNSKESEQAHEWLIRQIEVNPHILGLLAASAYCGLMQATLALPQYQDD